MPKFGAVQRYVRRAFAPYKRTVRRMASKSRVTGRKRARGSSRRGSAKRQRQYSSSQFADQVSSMGHTDVSAPVRVPRLPLAGDLHRKMTMGATRTYIAGGNSFYSSVAGKQRLIWFPTFNKSIFTSMGSDATINDFYENCYLKNLTHDLEFTNTSNNQLRLCIYKCIARRTVGNEPITAMDTGISECNMGANSLEPFIAPEFVPRFNVFWKIAEKTEVFIPAGGASSVSWVRKMNRVINPVVMTALENTAELSCGILFVWHGMPVKATTTTPPTDGACIGSSQITFTSIIRHTYSTVENNDQYNNVGNRNFQTGTGQSFILADTDAPSGYLAA